MHRDVERVLGRLATDAAFRRRFQADPEGTLAELAREGLTLSLVEIEALATVDVQDVARLAGGLDARLRKVL